MANVEMMGVNEDAMKGPFAFVDATTVSCVVTCGDGAEDKAPSVSLMRKAIFEEGADECLQRTQFPSNLEDWCPTWGESLSQVCREWYGCLC